MQAHTRWELVYLSFLSKILDKKTTLQNEDVMWMTLIRGSKKCAYFFVFCLFSPLFFSSSSPLLYSFPLFPKQQKYFPTPQKVRVIKIEKAVPPMGVHRVWTIGSKKQQCPEHPDAMHRFFCIYPFLLFFFVFFFKSVILSLLPST